MSKKKIVEGNEKCSQMHIVAAQSAKAVSFTLLSIACWWFCMSLIDEGHTLFLFKNTMFRRLHSVFRWSLVWRQRQAVCIGPT
jgi:hypothetical protein